MKAMFCYAGTQWQTLELHSRTATVMGVVVGQRAAWDIDWIFGILHPRS